MQLTALVTSIVISLASAADSTTRHLYATDPNVPPPWGLKHTLGFGINAGIPGTIPLYRCVSPSTGHYLLTLSSACEGAPSFQLEGILTNVFPSPQPGTVQLRRLIGRNGDHAHWLADNNSGQRLGGWLACDLGFYADETPQGMGYMYQGPGEARSEIFGYRIGCNSGQDNCCR